MKKYLLLLIVILNLNILYATNYFIDPINGSLNNDGSSEHPWSTLENVLIVKSFVDGDTLFLRTGFHGYNFSINGNHNSPVVIKAEEGQVPIMLRVTVNGSNWILDGLIFTPEGNRGHEIRNGNENGKLLVCATSSSNNIISNCMFYSARKTKNWTVQNWRDSVWSAIFDYGENNLITSNKIKNVAYAITAMQQSNHSTFEKNIVEIYSGDGIRCAGANNLTIQNNIIRNAVELDTDPFVNNHEDGIQGWGNTVGLAVKGNLVYSDTSIDSIPFVGPIQGIVIFDGSTTNAVFENNVVITEHWHGITVLGSYNSKYINNTILPVPGVVANQGPPWLRVDKKKDGTSSSSNIVRNNLATALVIEDGSSTVDHNMIHLSAKLFCNNYNNWDFTPKQDFVLNGLSIIDAGSSVDAPSTDKNGNIRPQGNAYDIGAYESPFSFDPPPDDLVKSFMQDFNGDVDTTFWANNWSGGKIVANRDGNTFKYVTDNLDNYYLGVVLDFKSSKDFYFNLKENPYVSFIAKANSGVTIDGAVVDSLPIGMDLINPQGTNISFFYTFAKIPVDGEWHKCYYDFSSIALSSGMDSVAKVRFNPGKEKNDGGVVYNGTIWIDNFKVGEAASNRISPSELTTFTEDFNTPINIELWRSNLGTNNDGTSIFTLTEVDNTLKYDMIQKTFSDGQYFDFFKYDSLRFNLKDNPYFTIDIKLDSGAMYGGVEVSTISFLASPWGISSSSGSDSIVRQVRSPFFDVPANGKWHTYTYNFGAELGEAIWDGTIPPGDFTNIEGILFETAKWPNPYTAVFYIDNFKLGEAAVLGGETDFPIISKVIPKLTDKFYATWKVKPTHKPMDGVTGFSKSEVSTFSNMGILVRFKNDKIDAYNGSGYEAENSLTFEAEKTYTIKVAADIKAQRYSVDVTPEGSTTPIRIGTDFTFRNISSQDTLGYFAMIINELGIWGGVPGSRLNPSFIDNDYEMNFVSNRLIELQTKTFSIQFDLTPTAQGLNSAVALSKSEASLDRWGDLSATLRLNDQNIFDAIDDNQYKTDIELEYIAATKYSITMNVNIPTQTYSVIIKPEGGIATKIATDYTFSASADTLNTLSQITIVGGLFGGSVGEVVLSKNAITDVELSEPIVPKEYSLGQNYPNPFNPTTKISYTIPKTTKVKISIYNSLGQNIKTLVNQNQIAGSYSVDWNSKDNSGISVSAGIYFYRINAGEFIQTHKMILLK